MPSDFGTDGVTPASTRLADIEAQLEAHFLQLSEIKRRNGESPPLFAIEHGLDPETVASLGQRLGSSLGDVRGMSSKFQLTWVVHAAERGYNFGGLEYWDSFARSTPNWWKHGDKTTLRVFFQNFSKRFHGLEPSGDWARHYKYICWPIAHALLPRDLQVQLAQAIYRSHNHLYIALRQSDEVLGRLIAHHAYYPTHRFALFLRDDRLTGWIVRTLLRGDIERSGLEPKALSRIVEDLRSESHARAWLAESRGVYQQHSLRPYGGTLGMPSLPWLTDLGIPASTGTADPRQEPALEPHLSLVRAADDEWMPVVTIPTFMHLAADNEELLNHLETYRVGVPCHGSKMGPASALLSPAGLERSLTTWPSERTPLLRFDQALPVFDDIVKSSCQLRPASTWLFKVGSDGTARLVLNATVRPGERYVLVARDATKLPSPWKPQRIRCDGVSAAAITIPDPVSAAFQTRLQESGLSAAYSVTLAPIGAVPVGWSPQSLGEWLTTQTPCFLLKRDHEFSHYSVWVQGETSTCIPCGSKADQIISLSGLAEGRHSVVISTHANAPISGLSAKALRSVPLSIVVRQPRSWAPGRQPLQAMLVTCHPASPTFSEFISGRVSLRADGDPSRKATVRLDLLDGAGNVTSTIPICEQHLPIVGNELREAIGRTLNASNDDLDFLTFDAAQVVIDGGDLGLRKIVLQQAVQPLRWRYLQERLRAKVMLVDDLEGSVVRVRTAPFSRPAHWTSMQTHQATSGTDVAAREGLYVATNADQESCVVVSAAVTSGGFEVFRVRIQPDDLPRTIEETLETYRVWSSARVCGLVSRHRQRQVLQVLQSHGIGLIAGYRWRNLEQALGETPTEGDWEQMEASAHWGSNYGILLSRAWAESDRTGDGLEDRFVKITMSLRLADEAGIARCAWRLAGGFQGIACADASDACGRYARKLGSSMRGARLLHLFAERNRSVSAMEAACKP